MKYRSKPDFVPDVLFIAAVSGVNASEVGNVSEVKFVACALPCGQWLEARAGSFLLRQRFDSVRAGVWIALTTKAIHKPPPTPTTTPNPQPAILCCRQLNGRPTLLSLVKLSTTTSYSYATLHSYPAPRV